MPGKIQWQKGDECDTEGCKSRWFYEEDGFRYCRQGGHQQEGQQTQQDDEDLKTQRRKTRRRPESQEATSQVYRGHTASSLYLQAYQLILWKQCHALIHIIGLPAELEIVVKDLWALRLQLVKDKTNATSGEEAVFSSQPTSDAGAESGKDDYSGTRKWKARGKAMPTLGETLGLLYLGMVLLRLPISIGELHCWAVREDVPFLRAIRFVPGVMKQRLPSEYLLALDTTSPLKADHLARTIHNLALFYTHHFKLIFPTINATLILYKHMYELALPVTLHPTTLSIAKLLSIDFAFPSPGRHQRTSALPEVGLISLLVIATKLYHPFTDHKHSLHARSLADPAALAVNWSAWTCAQKSHLARLNPEGHLHRGKEINVTEKDIMAMNGDQLDEYMDFYERMFLDETRAETKKRALPKQLLDMFPSGRQDESTPVPYNYNEQLAKEQASIRKKLASAVSSLEMRPIATEEDVDKETKPMIGSFYKRYRRVEDLDEHAKIFHETVADAVGIRLETLLVAVGQLERKLMTWLEARVKEGLEGDSEDSM